MELDPKSVFSNEIVVALFFGLAHGSRTRLSRLHPRHIVPMCSSGCGQILDDEPQLGPRENPFFTNVNRAGADSAALCESKLCSCPYPFRSCAHKQYRTPTCVVAQKRVGSDVS
jgi:hypothetical protein